MRRRRFKEKLSSQNEKCFPDTIFVDALEKRVSAAKLVFNVPDYIIAVETVRSWTSLSLQRREDLYSYPFIKFRCRHQFLIMSAFFRAKIVLQNNL
jgi:hypothetical protein